MLTLFCSYCALTRMRGQTSLWYEERDCSPTCERFLFVRFSSLTELNETVSDWQSVIPSDSPGKSQHRSTISL